MKSDQITNLAKRLFCDHEVYSSSEYEILSAGSYWDEQGEYRPYFEGVEHICEHCGKRWCTDVTGYRYYIDSERNLIEKVEREP